MRAPEARARSHAPPSLLLAGLLLLGIGCGVEDDRPESNRAMAEELERLARTIDARNDPFASSARIELLERMPERRDPVERTFNRVQLGQAHLNAGDTRRAIELLEESLSEVRSRPDAYDGDAEVAITESLAVAWLRLGEEQNCLLNPSSATCIMPLEGEGIHEDEEGSRNAIRRFSEVLEARPDDLTSRWLLNIAYMTLDRYPDEVPPEWLVPVPEAGSAGDQDSDFPPFYDIAPYLGLDVADLAGGSIVDDFTGNGYLDIMTSSWMAPSPDLAHPVRFFVNDGDGTFTERTREAGLEGIIGGLNMVHGDYTNNGHPDVLVLRGGWRRSEGRWPNSLLRNEGDGTFTDVTVEAGVDSRYPTQTAAWADFNNNGRLDLFVGNEGGGGLRHPSELYLNNGDGTFTDIAPEVGLDINVLVKGVVWGDYTNDGYPDLYVSVLGGPNMLFRNDGPDGEGGWSFTEVGQEAGVTEPFVSFPTWFWDVNNNGRLDLFVAGYHMQPGDVAREYLGDPVQGELPRLYLNNGDGTFTDATEEWGLDRFLYAMGANFGDLTNDGYPDFYVGTGDPDYRSLMPSRMFRNVEGRRFQEVTAPGRFGNLQKGHGISFADLNHSGAQDIHMDMGGALEGDTYQNLFLENPGFGNSWLTVVLEGTESNRMGVGARIEAVVPDGSGDGEAETRTVHRVVSSGGSFGGSPFRQHLGLGGAERVERLVVTWPASDLVQVFEDVGVDQVVRIREGTDRIERPDVDRFEYRTDRIRSHRPHHDRQDGHPG